MKGLIITYLLAIGGAGFSLVQPVIGLQIYALFSTLRPQALFGWAGSMEGLSQLVAIPMLLGWLVRGFGSWKFGRARAIVACLLAYFVWNVVSTLTSANPDAGWPHVIERAKIVLPFMVGVTMFSSMRHARVLAWIIVLANGYVSFELNLRYLSGFNEVATFGFGTMDNNTFAISLVATVGPALFLGLSSPKLWQKALAVVCAALIVHTVLLTFSRGGMFSLVVTGVVCFLIMPKRPIYIGAIVLTALVTLRFTGPELTERFGTIFAATENRDFSAASRLDLWRDCADAMIKRPVTGLGPGNWRLMAPEYGWTEGKEAHSLWFQTGAELGVPGVLFLLLFYVMAAWRGLQLIREGRKGDPWLLTCGCYTVTSVTGFVVAAQFVSVEGLEVPYFTVLVLAATLRLKDGESETAPEQVRAQPGLPYGLKPAVSR
jgi:putative inorganic carbon (hco3(-)) transporter